jgi:hypothetical protein
MVNKAADTAVAMTTARKATKSRLSRPRKDLIKMRANTEKIQNQYESKGCKPQDNCGKIIQSSLIILPQSSCQKYLSEAL